MDDRNAAFLRGVCEDMILAYERISDAAKDESELQDRFGEITRERVKSIVLNAAHRDLALAIAKCAITQAIFNVLVRLDEKRPVNSDETAGALVYVCPNGKVEMATTNLHELLGDVMSDAGLDVTEWFGL